MHMEMSFKLDVVAIFVGILATGLAQFNCYSCQGGAGTGCGSNLPKYTTERCEGPDAQCYFAVKWFQNGVIRLIERRCWRPPNGTTITDYCKSFNNPNGQLKFCQSCKSDLCNGGNLKCALSAYPSRSTFEYFITRSGTQQEFCAK